MEIENTAVFLEEDEVFLEEEDVKEETFTDTENTEVSEDSGSENKEDSDLRDFADEIRELWSIRPELKGKSLPTEVAQAAANGQRLAVAYFAYESKQDKDHKKESEILRRNAASAARAPVKGTVGGGGVSNGPKDPFLEGFETQWD